MQETPRPEQPVPQPSAPKVTPQKVEDVPVKGTTKSLLKSCCVVPVSFILVSITFAFLKYLT